MKLKTCYLISRRRGSKMPISAKELDLGASIEQLRQQFNNLVSDVTTLQASPTYGNALIFEGTSQDDYETTFTVLDPTADRVIYLPNSDGTLLMDTATITASLSTIIANNREEISGLTDDFIDSTGEAKDMAAIMDSGVGGALRKLKSQAEGVAIELGASLIPRR